MANTAGLPTYSGYRIAAMTSVYPATGIKAALYLASATRGPSDTVYSSTGEVTAGGGYTAGGATVTSATAPLQSGAVTYWTPSANISWTSLTTGGNVDCIQLYDTAQSNRVIGTFTFGATTITAGTLTLQMPTNDSSNALARWTWS
jgi:hypothetical protein